MRALARPIILMLVLVIFSIVAASAWAADAPAIDWWSVDGGGGSSSGGSYSLTGSIGQSETGVAQGGAFRLESGVLASPATRRYMVNLPLVVR